MFFSKAHDVLRQTDRALQQADRVLQQADWLTPRRVALWVTAFGFAWAFFLAADFYMHTTHGITDAQGVHIGRDFINYWSGARLAQVGQAQTVYKPDAYHTFQQNFAGSLSEFKLYSYPPVTLLLSWPLAFLPFLAGFALWTLTGFLLCAALLKKHVSLQQAMLILLATPACALNIVSGQNGFLTTALLAGSLLLLEKRPLTAGILIGLLCYKPQLGLLLPLALAAGGYWRSFMAAALTVIALVITTTLWLGPDIWPAFLAQMHLQSMMMQNGESLWHRMPAVFSSLRLLGLPVAAAMAGQIVSAAAAAWIVYTVWRQRHIPLPLKGAVLLLAGFAATPYFWDYDMAVLVFALFWVIADTKRVGWQPYEKTIWMFLMLLPLPAMLLAKLSIVQIGPVVLWLTLWAASRRAKAVPGHV